MQKISWLVCLGLGLSCVAALHAAPAKPPHKASVTTGCLVTQDDGEVFIDNSVANCGDYYDAAHTCHRDAHSSAAGDICGLQDMIKAVNPAGIDMIINPHRGVWALTLAPDAATNTAFDPNIYMKIGGAPENSLGGAKWAKTAGFKTLEIDFLLMRDDSSVGEAAPVITHFTDLRGFTDWGGVQTFPLNGRGGGGFIMNTDPHLMGGLKLRNREGAVDAQEPFLRLDTFLDQLQAQAPGMVVVLDVKFARPLSHMRQDANGTVSNLCIGFCGDAGYPESGRTAEAIKAIVSAVGWIDSKKLGNVVIKVPQGVIPTMNSIVNAIDAAYGSGFHKKVLFAPGPNASAKATPAMVLDFIDGWKSDNDWKLVSFWDTSIQSINSWMAKPFERNGVQYKDLPDYLYRVSGRRSATWVTGVSGPGGHHTNYAMAWTQEGNDPNEMRGDGVYSLVYSGARHALVTTDRPDLSIQIRNFLNQDDRRRQRE